MNKRIVKEFDETNKRINKLYYFIIATLVSSIGSLTIGVIVSFVLR